MENSEAIELTEEISKVTVEIPASEVEGFRSYLDSMVKDGDANLRAPFCCHLQIRDMTGEHEKRQPIDAGNIDEARVKCMQAAYDYYKYHPNCQVASSVSRGSC